MRGPRPQPRAGLSSHVGVCPEGQFPTVGKFSFKQVGSVLATPAGLCLSSFLDLKIVMLDPFFIDFKTRIIYSETKER